jgi:hypothetical protein
LLTVKNEKAVRSFGCVSAIVEKQQLSAREICKAETRSVAGALGTEIKTQADMVLMFHNG